MNPSRRIPIRKTRSFARMFDNFLDDGCQHLVGALTAKMARTIHQRNILREIHAIYSPELCRRLKPFINQSRGFTKHQELAGSKSESVQPRHNYHQDVHHNRVGFVENRNDSTSTGDWTQCGNVQPRISGQVPSINSRDSRNVNFVAVLPERGKPICCKSDLSALRDGFYVGYLFYKIFSWCCLRWFLWFRLLARRARFAC